MFYVKANFSNETFAFEYQTMILLSLALAVTWKLEIWILTKTKSFQCLSHVSLKLNC